MKATGSSGFKFRRARRCLLKPRKLGWWNGEYRDGRRGAPEASNPENRYLRLGSESVLSAESGSLDDRALSLTLYGSAATGSLIRLVRVAFTKLPKAIRYIRAALESNRLLTCRFG